MFISQFFQAVIVAISDQPECTKHQYFPELHARTTILFICRSHGGEYLKDLITQLKVCPYVL